VTRRALRADALLLTTAIIWGFAFVAQRRGMEFIGPFAYNGVRFALGAVSLLPLLLVTRRAAARAAGSAARLSAVRPSAARLSTARRLAWSLVVGLVLFTAANLQQVGLVTTSAGNAGFITGLYVVLVPLAGHFLGRPSGPRAWLGALVAVAGLYVLSVGDGFQVAPGDALEFLGALFWTAHILVINRLVSRMAALEIAVGQFATVSVLSLAVAVVHEPDPFAGVGPAAIPILYGGLLSIGVAYTLQIVAQKTAHPAHASIILSMEGLFAAIGGVLLIAEPLTARLVAGGALMLTGLVLSQLEPAALQAGEDHDGVAAGIVDAAEADTAEADVRGAG
jgi:drug/metabolite transporter (DMT)-like permease